VGTFLGGGLIVTIKRTLILAAIALASLMLTIATIGAGRRSAVKKFAPKTAQPGLPADDNRLLKEKAKEAKNFVGDKHPNRTLVCADLSELARNSSVVIIGTAADNISALSPDGKSITLDYKVNVEYVYKGALKKGQTVTVSLPGGKVMFEDGSTAEVRTPWFKKMQNGTTYLLFLSDAPGGRSFFTTGEAQGLFEIPTTEDGRVVKTHSGVMNDPVWKYHNMDVKAFFKELRQVFKKDAKG
jgi:hypothetical protein